MAASATNIAPRAVGEGSPHFAAHALEVIVSPYPHSPITSAIDQAKNV